MFISLWKTLRGYVMIEVSGYAVERFINMAAHKGLYIWNVRRGADAVSMNVSVKAFRELKSCAKKTGSRIRIAERRGLPFALHRYRKRKLLMAGFAVFVLALYALSLFVWRVDVAGNERLGKEAVAEFCGARGLRPGAFKGRVDVKALERELLAGFEDIGWVNVHIKGTNASVSLKEVIPPQVIVDRKTPCDIVAEKDALVESVAASAGTPMVKPGDVAGEGDILVSGELVVKNDETGIIKEYVHANAMVLGKLYYEINLDIPLEYTEKAYTRNTKKRYGLILFGNTLQIPEKDAPFECFDRSTSRTQLSFGSDYPLPVILLTTVYKEFTPVTKTRTAEQAKELSQRLVTGRIVREFDISADVVEKQFHFTENADRIFVECIVTTIENIGRQRMIEPVEPPGEVPAAPPAGTE